MNVQSNTYTVVYSSVIVVIVATFLTIAAVSLQPQQEKNVEIEKKQNILSSLRIEASVKEVEKLYDTYITKVYTINSKGEVLEGIDAFTINMREQNKLAREKRELAVYEAVKNDSAFVVVPVYGKGLWGPIWGYLSFLKEDSVSSGLPQFNAIYGAVFDHKGETPGLGAEINMDWFEHPFRGKTIFDETGKFVSIGVMKGGNTGSNPHQVDAISGGTITSKGLEAMLDSSLVVYKEFFIGKK